MGLLSRLQGRVASILTLSYTTLFLYIITALVAYGLYLVLIKPNTGRLGTLKLIPSRPRHVLLGHLHDWKPGPEGYKWFSACARDFKDIYTLWIGPTLCMVIPLNPDDVRKIVQQDPPKAEQYNVLHSWLGNGLLTVSGDAHRPRRKMLTPSFHFSALKGYFPVFVENANALVEMWRKDADGGKIVDIQSDLAYSTLDIIGKCAFGMNFDALHNHDHEFVKATLAASELAVFRIVNPLLSWDYIYDMTPNGRKWHQAIGILHRYADEAVAKRKKDWESGRPPQAKDFLDILLSARDENGEGMTAREMRDEVSTFMFEGHDTTSSGLQWTLTLLAQHPDIQRKVHAEVDEVFGNRSSLDDPEDLTKLPYLDRVLKESHRIYSPVPSVSRTTTQDLELAGYHVPAGTLVAIHPQSIHQHPANFPNPENFNPDRWLQSEVDKRHPLAHIPFSAGSRNCIGQKFALMEEKVVISTVLRHFELELAPGFSPRPHNQLVIRNDGPLELKLVPRM